VRGLSQCHRHIAAPKTYDLDSQTLDPVPAGRMEAFVGASAVYAVGTAIIGASPAAYAADVMPAGAAGLGLGIYRCFGDLGEHELVIGSGLSSNSCFLDSFGASANQASTAQRHGQLSKLCSQSQARL